MRYLLTVLFVVASVNLYSQVYSNKVVGKNSSDELDSMKRAEYPYMLPIWGEKATRAGFNLPYSAGLGINYLWQESELVIDNLKVGFNNREMHDLSEVVRFNSAVSEASGVNFRPDIWLFPFLNIYGIFAQSSPSTSVDFGIYVPDSTGKWNNVINLNSKAEFKATTMGVGLTPTIGLGGGWLALDMNFTWNDISELDKPAFAFVFGPRMGKSFKLKRPDSNIAFWVGGFRLKLNTGTQGSVLLSDIMDLSGLDAKVDNGIASVQDASQQVDAWWTGLTPVEQKNPINVVKHESATKAINKASGFLNSLDESLNDSESSSVQYSLDKRPKDMWNFIVGTQYQFSKSWMIRAEYGFLGSRDQVIAGLQYRFGL